MGDDQIVGTYEIKPEIKGILQDYATSNSVKITEIQVSSSSKHNFLSDVFKCKIIGVRTDKINEEAYERSFVIKQLPRDKNYVTIYNCRRAFKNEHYAYKVILPNLQKYSPRPLPIPECIHSSDDFIILEDLSSDNFQHFDKLTGFSINVIEEILRELANLHAASLIMHHKDKTQFESISSLAEEVLYASEGCNRLVITQERSIRLISQIGQVQKLGKKVMKIIDDLKGNTRIAQLNLLSRKDHLSVINHGDMWAHNIFWKNGQIRLIDFQIMRHTSIAADLTYFFYVNLDPDYREAHQEGFLQFYLSQLLSYIKPEQLPFERDLTMKWLNSEMKKYALFGFISGLWVMPVFFKNFTVVKTEEEFRKYEEESLEKTIAAMSPAELERTVKHVYHYTMNE